MERLNDFEQAVIDKLLEGDHPVLAHLRAQVERACVTSRRQTGHGFFTHFGLPLDERPLSVAQPDFDVSDVWGDIDGLDYGASFVLFVRDGLLAVLEGAAFGSSPWPDVIRGYELRYMHEPRDLRLPDLGC